MHPFLRKLRYRAMQVVSPERLTWDELFRPPWAIRGQGGFEAGERSYWFGDTTFSSWKQSDSITIGKYCSIASGAVVMAGGNHLVDALSTYPFTMIERWREWNAEPQPDQHLVIGNDVWIGARAMVLGDVTIGDGAVIGAGAVVIHDVPPYAVAVGVPARIVRHRFTSEDIALMQLVKWWDWPEDKILAAEKILREGDAFVLAEFAEREGLLPSTPSSAHTQPENGASPWSAKGPVGASSAGGVGTEESLDPLPANMS